MKVGEGGGVTVELYTRGLSWLCLLSLFSLFFFSAALFTALTKRSPEVLVYSRSAEVANDKALFESSAYFYTPAI